MLKTKPKIKKKQNQPEAIAYLGDHYGYAEAGYGVYLIAHGQKYKISGSDLCPLCERRYRGEVIAALAACELAKNLGITTLEIRYRHPCVARWAMNGHKAKDEYIAGYQKNMQEYQEQLDVRFRRMPVINKNIRLAKNLAWDTCGKQAIGVDMWAATTPVIPAIDPEKCCITDFV